jgi:uncharacterized secreted protein with C-terminal beta-propeller domain
MRSKHGAALALAISLAGLTAAASFDEVLRVKPSPRTPTRRARTEKPVHHSDSLKAITDCEELRSFFLEVAVEHVLEYRYNQWRWIAWSGGPEPGGGAEDAPTDFTTTNNQEQGVDELDIVKTNGTHLYATERDTLHVLQSWPADATREVASVGIGLPSWGMFLHGDFAVAASGFYEPYVEFPRPPGATRLEVFDVANPSSPVSVRTVDVEGWLVDARLIDGDLYAVIRTFIDYPPELWDLAWNEDIGLPDLPWDADDELRDRVLAEARSIIEPLVEEIMADHAVEEFLPQVRDTNRSDPDSLPTTLFDCDSLYRPANASDWSVLSVLHFDLDNDGPVTATGILADGWTVYASQTSLYVAQTSDSWSWWWGWAPAEMTTEIHRFELDPSRPSPVRYTASGSVDGWILDQFALSEHDGYLRVATTEFDWWWGATPDEEQASSVTVLRDDGWGKLRQVGHVGGLGPGERIFAVRFMGARGYVVTFEQIDPLYTLDFSDPTQPKVIGELEVTGFSSYLHPIGDDWLLAVGQEADGEGRVIGLAVSIFDVRDFADPKLAHRYLIEGEDDTWSWSDALHDHHAFTYHRGVLSIPAYIGGEHERFSGLLVLAANPEDGIYELGRIDHHDLSSPEGRAWMRRSVYIEDAIYSLSSAGVKVNSLDNPEVELAKVPFGE